MRETETISWQKAVALMTAERGRAEAAAAVIKRLGGPGDIAKAELTYGAGRADTEAVMSALTIALEQGAAVDDITDLEARLGQACAAREKLGLQAMALAEAAPGEKGVVLDLLSEALPDLLAALGALWRHWVQREAGLRTTIAERLQAARWPAFAEIAAG
jgi:hypothetical protein